MEKRKRCSNFSKNEREVLFNIIEKHKSIIENKKTDGATNQEKEAAWQLITDEFNYLAASNREKQQLKLCWANAKRKVKESRAHELRMMGKTGVESKTPSPQGETEDNESMSMKDESTIQGLSNPYDNDADYFDDYVVLSHSDDPSHAREKKPVLPAPDETSMEQVMKTDTDGKWIPNGLRTSKSTEPNVGASNSHSGKSKPCQKTDLFAAAIKHSEIEKEEKTTLFYQQYEINEIKKQQEKIKLKILKLDLKRKKLEMQRDFNLGLSDTD